MDRNFRRLVDTLALIPEGRLISTAEIRKRLEARGHSVTMRTIQRDLYDLADQFGIECDERSKPFGWRWRRNAARVSLPAMDWTAAISFNLIEQHMRLLLPGSELERLRPYFDEARRRLHSAFPDVPIKAWPERIRVVSPEQPRISPPVLPAVHAAVTEGLLLGLQLDIEYRAKNGKSVETHRIHPLGLVQHGRVYYLVATYYEYQEPRMLVLHRICKAKLLDQPAVRAESFSLDRWITQGAFGFGGTRKIRLVAEFRRVTAEHLIESPISANQSVAHFERAAVAWTRISATVIDNQRLQWWLLGFGAKVQVIKPASLRTRIAYELTTAARRYRNGR